jgi:diguanylate cyclase (GGDEF)-like protein/PAS domain S-box-containing protein
MGRGDSSGTGAKLAATRERAAHLRFIENLERVNAAIRGTQDLEQMMSEVLDTTLAIFDCDRAWLVFPCDPEAVMWRAMMERTRPEYPGALALNREMPVSPEGAKDWRILRAADGAVSFGPGCDYPLTPWPVEQPAALVYRSWLGMTLYPKVGSPWAFGLHQCSYARVWNEQDRELFAHIGVRLADALTSLLTYQDLKRREREFRTLVENSPDWIARVDSECRYLYVGPSAERGLGVPPGSLLGRRIGASLIGATKDRNLRELQRVIEAVQRAFATGETQHCEIALITRTGLRVDDAELAPERDESGKVTSVLWISRDMTELKRNAQMLQRLNRALLLLSKCNQMLIGAENEQALLQDVCRLIVEVGGYRLAAVSVREFDPAKSVRLVTSFASDGPLDQAARLSWGDESEGGPLLTALRTGEKQLSQDLMREPRLERWRSLFAERGVRSAAALPITDKHGLFAVLSIYGSEPNAFVDEEIALLEELAADLGFGLRTLRTRQEHRAAQQDLAFLARHDPLTKLPNRLLLRERFQRVIGEGRPGTGLVAMCFLDLDGFKEINDSLGHEIGDQLLVSVAERLQSCIRSDDMVCREGGDEFLVVLSGLADREGPTQAARAMLEAMEAPFMIGDSTLHTTLSIGISLYPEDAQDFEALRRNSDAALFHAKDAGRNTFRFFDESMNREAVLRVQLQASLRSALQKQEFRLVYQPLVRAADGHVFGVEALLRWRRKEGELVGPTEFISVAEQSGLIVPIGQWVLDEACRQGMIWRRAGLTDISVAVNLSVVQFSRGDVVEAVAGALQRSGLPPHALELELTESVLLRDTEAALRSLQSLKKLGIRLSIDDFGTGFSSLAYVKRLDVDKLKVADTFTKDMVQNAQDAAIVRAIIQMGQTLELDVVAEGVETAAQAELLRKFGCNQMQGFHFGRPMPPDELSRLLRARR